MTLANDALAPEPEEHDDSDTETEGVMFNSEAFHYLPFEAKLREWNLQYEIVPDFPIDSIRRDPSVQVRGQQHIAPRDRVDEYTQQMKNGAQFPPIILYKPDILIDGNTRLAAAKRVGRKTFPAIIVNARRPEMGKILAASVNQMGGERLTVEEAHEAAQLMMREGYPDAAVARELGRDLTQVRRWRAEKEVREHAEKLNMSVEGIPATSLRTLVAIPHDEPFAELAKLFGDVRPTVTAAKDMVTRVAQAPSDEDAVKVIEALREELAPEGPPPHRENRNREAQTARMAIGNLLKLEGRPLAVWDPAKRDEDLERWERLAAVAQEVVQFLRNSNA